MGNFEATLIYLFIMYRKSLNKLLLVIIEHITFDLTLRVF